jgi:nicotinamidase-related amidase/MFS family permease
MSSQPSRLPGTARPRAPKADRYRWVALTNTTMAVFMSTLDGSIILIALPAIFNGIHLDPLAPANIAYLLWMIMGYRLVQAVFVVNLGRLGDILGRVRIYNLGFVVFTVASILLSLDPFTGSRAALWLIGWRFLQAFGGSMLSANSAAILTDAFPPERRGFALGVNQVAGIAGMFLGLTAGGLLAAWDWRAVFWVNVPVGIAGTLWAYFRLRDNGVRHPARIDWWGNATYAVGLSAILVAVTYGIQSYDGHTMGWSNPAVIAGLAGGVALLAVFIAIERRVAEPLFQLRLFKIRAFTAGNLTGFTARLAQGGLQFVLIIWLQGIWLPLHGYDYSQTPFWAGIFLLPLTAGFFVAGPVSGALSDRFGARWFASGGMLLFAMSFVGLMVLPVNFPYLAFALLIALNGVGIGMYSSPNSSSIMSSVPAEYRGVASGMRATFQNSGTSLSIGVFFSLMIAGLASTLPHTLTSGLAQHGVSHQAAAQIGSLPPVSSLFAAMLGVNPVHYLLSQHGALSSLTPANQALLTGREFFPDLISGPFHDGLVLVFAVSAALGVIAAIVSLMRGRSKPPAETGAAVTPAAAVRSRPFHPSHPQGALTMPLTTLDPTPALVVIDLQKGIVSGPVAHVVPRAAVLAKAFRRHDLPVVLVNVTGRAPGRTDAGGRSGHSGAGPLPAGWADIVDELEQQPGDYLITKRRRSAFHDTGLDTLLRDLGVTQIVLAGVSTSAGVESTARSAHDHGYHVVLATDAMADHDPGSHRHSLERVFPKLGQTATSAEITGFLDRRPGSPDRAASLSSQTHR